MRILFWNVTYFGPNSGEEQFEARTTDIVNQIALFLPELVAIVELTTHAHMAINKVREKLKEKGLTYIPTLINADGDNEHFDVLLAGSFGLYPPELSAEDVRIGAGTR